MQGPLTTWLQRERRIESMSGIIQFADRAQDRPENRARCHIGRCNRYRTHRVRFGERQPTNALIQQGAIDTSVNEV